MKALIRVAVITVQLFPFIGQGQQFNISWTDNSKFSDSYVDAVLLKNGYYLMRKIDKSRSGLSVMSYTSNPAFVLVDKDMHIVKESSFELTEKKAGLGALRRFGNDVFYTYEEYESKQHTIYAVKINQETLKAEKKTILATLDEETYGIVSGTVYKISQDSSKVLLFAEDLGKKKANKQLYTVVFDSELKKIWSRTFELPMSGRMVSIEDQDVTNDGKILVAVKQYEKTIITDLVQDKSHKVPPYEYKIFQCTKEGPAKERRFDVGGHFIEGTRLAFDRSGLVTVAGLYKKSPNGRVTGIFYNSFDSTVSVISKNQMLVFPKEILELVDKDGQGKSDGSDPGVSEYLRIKNILRRSNGTIDLITEVQELNSYTQNNPNQYFYGKEYRNYIYGDIVNVNLDKEGRGQFTRVPKRQEGYQGDMALGYYPLVYGDKLVLLYNDHADNMTKDLSKAPDHFATAKKAVLAAAIIDSKGLLTRKAVYTFREEKQMALPKNFYPMSDGKYVMASVAGNMMSFRFGFGSLEVK